MIARRGMVRAGVALGSGVLVVAALAAAAALWTRTARGSSVVRRVLVSQLNDRIEGQLEIGSLDIGWNRYVLRDVILRDPDGGLVARVPRVEIEVRLRSLVRRELDLRQIEVESPRLHLRLGPEGTNLQRALAVREPVAEPRWGLRMRRLLVRGGAADIAVADAGRDQASVRVEGIEVTGNGHLDPTDPSFTAVWKVTGAAVRPQLGELQVEGSVSGADAVEAGNARIAVGDLVRVDGRILGRNRVRVDVRKFEIPPSLAASVLPTWPIVVPLGADGTFEVGPTSASFDLRVLPTGQPGRLLASGNVMLEGRRTPDGIVLRVEDLDPLLLVGEGRGLPLALDLRVQPGPLDVGAIRARLSLSAPSTRTRGGVWGPLSVQAGLADGVLAPFDVSVVVPGARLVADGGGPLGRLRALCRLDVSSLMTLRGAVAALTGADLPDVGGRGTVEVALGGAPFEGPGAIGVRLDTRFPRARIGGTWLSGVRLSLDLPPPRARDRRFVLSGGLRAPQEVSFEADGSRLAPPEGQPSLLLGVDRLSLEYAALAGGRTRWRLDCPARIGVEAGTALVDGLVLTSGGQRVALDGSVRGGALSWRMALARLQIGRLPRGLGPGLARVDGLLHGSATVAGSPRDPVVEAAFRLRHGRGLGITDVEADIEANVQQGRAWGTLAARAPTAALAGRYDLPARWPVPPHSPVFIAVELERFDLTPVSVPRAPVAVSGEVSGSLLVTGTTSAPAVDVQGQSSRLRLASADAESPTAAFDGTARFRARHDTRGARVLLALADAQGGRFVAEGRWNVRLPLPVLLEEPGRLSLRDRPLAGRLILERFDPSWLGDAVEPFRAVKGQIDANLQAQGTLREPRFEGGLRWRKGRVVVVSPPARERRTDR